VTAEKARLTKELEKAAAEISKVEQKLNNPQFVGKVPSNVLQEHQQRLVEWQTKYNRIKTALEELDGK
jgi:valyl-tRNA synthetase